jgi:5-methylcytosine-specific restriction protein B
MNRSALVEIVHSQSVEGWRERNQAAFGALFGTPNGRYPQAAEKELSLRAPEMNPDSGVTFAAYIAKSNPNSGAYGGLSFVIFPALSQPCLVGMVVGTGGLEPDEAILGRPGHARKAQAICAWLNKEYGDGKRVAWAKQDPTRTDIQIPDDVAKDWAAYKSVFDRYGKVVYALFRPSDNRRATELAVNAFLDLLMEERGFIPLSEYKSDCETIRGAWLEHLMPSVDRAQVKGLLDRRRYAIIQGPPGTGKTEMATDLLREEYGGRGRTIQLHPNTTYENFVGGLAPVHSGSPLGLQFSPTKGFLMEVAAAAKMDPGRQYLLHIDEINRADLGKTLGEAIFLLEPDANVDRQITLPYDFGEPFKRTLSLPKNLHILGTMNTADRSIAIVDIAVRRRFAFVSLWPSMKVVDDIGCDLMRDAFRELLTIFVEHATPDAFSLMPGHSYFLEKDEKRAKERLLVSLVPLLEEYLAQGYVNGFAEQVRSYLQWLRSL